MLVDKGIITLDGFHMHAVTSTNYAGLPVVVLHGLAVDSAAYTELLELLDSEGFRVLAIDAPNHGGSDDLPLGSTIKDMAGKVHQAVKQLLGTYQYILIGHSMGGAIAIELAADHPEDILELVLLNAAAGKPHHEAIEPGNKWTLPLRGLSFIVGTLWDVLGDTIHAGKKRGLGERLDLFKRLRRSAGISREMLTPIWALMQHDADPSLLRLRKDHVEVHHVHSDMDHMIKLKSAREAALRSGGHLHLVPGRFHAWPISDPKLASRMITNLITGAAA
jgi:pimeloyl-ACP methyl ester carboxylesterase